MVDVMLFRMALVVISLMVSVGLCKQALWEAAGTPEILEAQRAKFQSLFTQLGVGGSRALVERYVTQVADPLPPAPADLLR